MASLNPILDELKTMAADVYGIGVDSISADFYLCGRHSFRSCEECTELIFEEARRRWKISIQVTELIEDKKLSALARLIAKKLEERDVEPSLTKRGHQWDRWAAS